MNFHHSIKIKIHVSSYPILIPTEPSNLKQKCPDITKILETKMHEYLQFKIMKLKYSVLILLIMKQNSRTTCLNFAWKIEKSLLGILPNTL
jgi:hypothetical protein